MKKKLSGRFLVLLLTLCFLCIGFSVPALALDENTDGSITIKVDSVAEGVGLGLYKVGGYASGGAFELSSTFRNTDFTLDDIRTASSAEEAAEKLTAFTSSAEPDMKVSLTADGSAVFNGLSYMDQLYLICQLDGDDIVMISPMLVPLRYYEDDVERNSAVIDAKFVYIHDQEVSGAVLLTKLDENDKVLAGAEFSFERKVYVEESESASGEKLEKDDNGSFRWEMVSKSLVTDVNGQIAVKELPMGEYRFIEVKAPVGYILDSKPHVVNVSAGGSLKVENGVYVKGDGEPVMLTVHNTPVQEESPVVPPTPKPSKPSQPVITGDQIAKYIIVGVVVAVSLVAVILLFVLGRKGKKNDDDDDE